MPCFLSTSANASSANLNGRHPVARELLQFVERVVVEGDQLAHDRVSPAPQRDAGSMVDDGNGSGPGPVLSA
jgi:hypothetical protein